ncbi:BolA family protein [Granulosicoccus antarcticus]|uniref:Acid stress protein IbaG n=1 Tax=Granulosicoccus antarcticus IMCC3135 TaxID=1192854 RepID=A0A2Z2P997_9GAMM|nr:BolA/IbaG family iron-sulfur metabolism protein [Granulosicoccus antarcticus]ASJ76464.1 Acid stress protein IbaG [Granulosicoccus antarcticus IMCC3135]
MRMDFFSDLVEQSIADSQAEITGDGSKFEARVVSDSFEGLSTLKRHKLVYAILDEHIKSGAIHALSIKTFTKKEWSESSQAS